MSAKKTRSAVKEGIERTSRSHLNRKLKGIIIALLLIFMLALFLNERGYIKLPEFLTGDEPDAEINAFSDTDTAQVHFIDVGQGDCTLIIADDGSTMLIDCGEYEYVSDVLGYLEELGIERLDYILVTHPHTDHMGGMATIIRKIPEVGTFIMPRIPDEYIPTTTAYEKMLDDLEKKDCKVKAAKTETVNFGSGKLEFITADYSGENMNNYSVVVRYTYKDVSFLLSGDLEKDMESEILEDGYDISADVYKLAHHGSSTSNSALWLAAIDPEYFVCECGTNNQYGHPHREIVEAVRDYADFMLRTDLNGNIVFETDGFNISYTTEK